MFLRVTGDINYYLKRTQWIKYFDEYNITRKTSFYIKKIESKVKEKSAFSYFKYWILWRWVNNNFDLSEKFIFNLKKNIKKMRLTLSSKEERFVMEIEELIFNSWRPLKELPVRFSLEKKEKINLVQTNVYVHSFEPDNLEKKIKQIGKFDFYLSNRNLFLTNTQQKIQNVINYDKIKSVNIENFGVIVETDEKKYLFRGKNKFLSYALLQRMVPRLKLNLQKTDKFYDYFDFWNYLMKKIN